MESAASLLSLVGVISLCTLLLPPASSQQISDISVKLGPEEITVITRVEDRAVAAGKMEGNLTESEVNRQMPRNAYWGKDLFKSTTTGDEERDVLFHAIVYSKSILINLQKSHYHFHSYISV